MRDIAANSTSFALRVHLPLWDAGRGALADAEDRTTIALRRLDLEEMRNQIELEVRDAVRRMVDAARRVELFEASNQVAAEQLRINAERYERGLLDTTGFLASQDEAEAARLGRMGALLDLYHARARLRLLTLESGY
jgi:outer membrane protein TolC